MRWLKPFEKLEQEPIENKMEVDGGALAFCDPNEIIQ